MDQDLVTATEFYVITFPTTQTALQAEKALDIAGEPFILIPVPGEISAGCGLAVKCTRERKNTILQILSKERIKYSSIHLINRRR